MNVTPFFVTRLGEHVFDKELAELDDDEIDLDDDHSDEQFDRIDRNNEPRGW